MSINCFTWYAKHIETEQFLYIYEGDAEYGPCAPTPKLYDEPTMFSSYKDVVRWIHVLGFEKYEFEILNEDEEG